MKINDELSTEQAANFLGLTEAGLRGRIKAGTGPKFYKPRFNKMIFLQADLEEYLQDLQQKAKLAAAKGEIAHLRREAKTTEKGYKRVTVRLSPEDYEKLKTLAFQLLLEKIL